MMKNFKFHGRGFTLIEVIISVLIIGLFLTIMFGVFIYGANTIAVTRHYQQAIGLSSQKLEQIKSIAYSELTSGTIAESSVVLDNALICSRSTVIASDTVGKKISVTVSWTQRALGGGSKQLSVMLETLRYQ